MKSITLARCVSAAAFPFVFAMITSGIVSHLLRLTIPGYSTLSKAGGLLLGIAIYVLVLSYILKTSLREPHTVLIQQSKYDSAGGLIRDSVLCILLGIAMPITVIVINNILNQTNLSGSLFLTPEWSKEYHGEKTIFQFLYSEIGLSYFGVMFVSVLFEEFIFRGFMFGTFRLRFNPAFAFFGVTIFFAISHGLDRFLLTAYAGAVYLIVYLVTKRITSAILVHLFHNFTPPFLIFFGINPSLFWGEFSSLLWGWLSVITVSTLVYALYRFNRGNSSRVGLSLVAPRNG
jgi:membrane protease YdiL (CAAX protease family)